MKIKCILREVVGFIYELAGIVGDTLRSQVRF